MKDSTSISLDIRVFKSNTYEEPHVSLYYPATHLHSSEKCLERVKKEQGKRRQRGLN